jgi:hypothetical protein
MQNKMLFNSCPVSYSQFLQPENKEHYVQVLTGATNAALDSDFFKRSIAMHYQHFYVTKKRQNWIYRLLFFGFALLFLILAMMIFFKTVNFACSLYFKNGVMVKNLVDLVCLLFAGSAFTIGYKIHPERDAMRDLVGKVEREMSHPAKHLQIEFNAIIANLSPNNLKRQLQNSEAYGI